MTPNYQGNEPAGGGAGGRGDAAAAPRPPPTMETGCGGMAGAVACIPTGASRHGGLPSFRASPGSIRRGPQHPGVPGAGLGERG